MTRTPQPPDESARQDALRESGLLETGAEERFERITRLAKRAFSVPIALLTLLDEHRQWFKSCQGLDLCGTSRETAFCSHAVAADAPLVVADTLEDARFAGNPLVTGPPWIRFYAGVPVHSASGYPLGTLCILDTAPRALQGDELETLRDLAGTAEEMVVADAHRHAATSAMQKELAAAQERAHLVIEGTQVATWQWNVNTGETVFNERWAEIVGYTLSELAPVSIDTWMGLTHPDDLACSETLLNKHFRGEAESYECKVRMRHKDGHWVWVQDRGRVLQWTADGEPLLMYGTHADITDEVEARQLVEASRDEFASLVANMPGITYRCLLNHQWTMLFISEQIANIGGYAPESLLHDSDIRYRDLIHPDDAAAVEDDVYAALAEGREWHVEYRLCHRDGTVRWVEGRGRAVTDDGQGVSVLEGFIVDITRERDARHELARNHKALVLLNEIAFYTDGDLGTRIERALHNARTYLGMDMACVSEVEGDACLVRWLSSAGDSTVASGERVTLSQTWCHLLFEQAGQALFIEDTAQTRYQDEPFAQVCPVGAYVGVVIQVEGKPFGALTFTLGRRRSTPFDDSERLFVRLFARWLGDAMEQCVTRERLDKLFAQLPGMIYQFRLFPDGSSVFPFSSPGIEGIYGVTAESAARDAGPVFETIHPDDLEGVAASIQQSAEALENWQHIYRVRGPGGGYRWMAGRARPESLSDGSILWHGYIHDIDEQERARQALALSEQRLRSLFKFAPVGIALSDFETGRFLDANEALLQPSGYTWGEFVHLSHGAVTPAEYQADERKAVEDLGTMGQYGPLEEEYLRKDGSRYPVRVQGMVSREPDGRQVIWSLVEDITERRRIETMKDQFIATVSHELRTPLTAINGSLDLLVGGAAGSLPDKAERLLANAQRNGKRLGDLINDLLDMEKLVAGRMPMKREPLAVGPIVSDAIEAMTEFARQHGVGINAPDDSLSAQVHVDPARLIQAITNLLSNAIKFSPVGQAVDVDIEPDGADVAIVVRDYGPGVDPSFRDQLFTRFAREDSANNRRLAGTGLGLSITREIVEQMGGAVAYQDAARGGSRFLICLPVVAPH